MYTNIIELNWNYPTLRIIPLPEAIGCQIKSYLSSVKSVGYHPPLVL